MLNKLTKVPKWSTDLINFEIHNHPKSTHGLFKGTCSILLTLTLSTMWEDFRNQDHSLNTGVMLDHWIAYHDPEGPKRRRFSNDSGEPEPVLGPGDYVAFFVKRAN